MLGGIFGIKSEGNCIDDLLTGIFSLQHRGQDYCGAVTSNGQRLISFRHEGKVSESFTEEEQRRLLGNSGIGGVHPYIKQPISFESRFGDMSLVYAGKILNRRSLRNKLKKRGHSLSIKHTDAEITGKLITEESDAKNIVQGLEKMASEVEGVYALGILSKHKLYCMKSPTGVEPLIAGYNNSLTAFSSEYCALKELGIKPEQCKDIRPGEIVCLSQKKIESVKTLDGKEALCGFCPGYWGRIDSIFNGISVKLMRERAGRTLAQEDKNEDPSFKPDIVIPVRDSGVGYAIGYSHILGVYDEGLFKNWYVDRTFLKKSRKARIEGVNRKQSVIIDAVKDKVVVLVDDSIREGTTMRNKLVPLVRWGGAKEVHVRIGSPQNKYGCRYSLFPKSRGNLLSAGKSLKEQRDYLGSDSLKFISIRGYINALGTSEENLCLGCWTNDFPL
jgi:amidophosphoribosyltransferase